MCALICGRSCGLVRPRRLGLCHCRNAAEEAGYRPSNCPCAFLVQTKGSRDPTQIDARSSCERCHFRLGFGWRRHAAENQGRNGQRIDRGEKCAAVQNRIKTAGDEPLTRSALPAGVPPLASWPRTRG
jgi:hypothetical protein